MADKISTHDSKFYVYVSGVYHEILNIKKIEGFNTKKDIVDETVLGSTIVEKRPSAVADIGGLKVSYFADTEDVYHAYLAARAKDDTTFDCKLVLPNNVNYIFTGFVEEHNQSGVEPKTGRLMVDVTVTASSDITKGVQA